MRWRTAFRNKSIPMGLELTISVHDGRLRCDEVLLTRNPEARSISTTNLRSINLAALIEAAAKGVTVIEIKEDWTPEGSERAQIEAAERANRLHRRLRHSTRAPRGDREQVLESVVNAYRLALAANDPSPRKTVSEELGYSHAYVGKLLVEARKSGILGPARAGRAEEIQSRSKAKSLKQTRGASRKK